MKHKEGFAVGRHCFPYQHIKTHNPAFSELEDKPVAYFCAEYGIEENLPIYAGGLGILAGDFVLEAGEMGLPLVAIGLLYHKGFPTYGNKDQVIDPESAGFSVLLNDEGQPILLDIEVGEDIVYAQVWVRVYGSAHVFLLDTEMDRNSEEYRAISHHLYSADFSTKLLQDLILSVGGVKLLRCLDISPSVYHLNEGHTAFVPLALAVEYMHDNPGTPGTQEVFDIVRQNIVGTKHTILPGAGVFFDGKTFSGIIDKYLGRHNVNFDDFFAYGMREQDSQTFSSTKFLIKGTVRANAVSLLHATFEKRYHPSSKLLAITNGIHLSRWRAKNWGEGGLTRLTDGDIWKIHEENRKKLLEFVKKATGTELDTSVLTITWARRFAGYKRPELLFTDIERLSNILNSTDKPAQVLIAGLAHRDDIEGQKLISHIEKLAKDKRIKGKVVYIPSYDIKTAKMLIAGSDIWLSTPERGKEACGTSSMKAGLNGVLQFSTSDGWLEEVDWSDKGWIMPDTDTAEHLYEILEKEIVPLFYGRNHEGLPIEWVQKMRLTMGLIEEYYSAKRMINDYIQTLYFPQNS